MNIPLSKIIWAIVIAIAAFLAYSYFFGDTSQEDLITRFQKFVYRSSDENESSKAIKPKEDSSDAWVN